MKTKTAFAICAALSVSLAMPVPLSAASAKTKDKCQIYARKQADKKMGPKAVENAMVVGATAGLAGQKDKKKKKFYGFGLSGAVIGLVVVGGQREKHYQHYLKRCMSKA